MSDKKIFLICPVRNATEEQKSRMEEHIKKLEDKGIKVHYPARDTNQEDSIGFRICKDNARAIQESDEVHVFFDKSSTGSMFDLGVAFAFKKPLVIVNEDELESTHGKSFTNMILYWSGMY